MSGLIRRGRWAWLTATATLSLTVSGVSAQTAAPLAPAQHASPSSPAALPPNSERIPEGTEVKVRFDEDLSSATAQAGDTFSISTDEDIRLDDGTVIPAGYRGKGEVSDAHKKEMLGKAGELKVRLDYVRIGDVRVHLRANKSGEGQNTLTTTIVLTVLLTPLFLMHHGHEIVFPKGTTVTAYVDEDTTIPLPIADPPKAD
jgi:hypothetical protein